MSVNCGLPTVNVPVLSSTIAFILFAISREAASFTKMPRDAALPEETIIAIGVASPSAHGHAMMRTATKLTRAKLNAGVGPKKNQTIKVVTAITTTTGTKYDETRSARRWIGAFDPC